ncbi:hypothetical protein AN401_03535 [Zobellella denitrificans]|uniref:DUF4136 domain-containing protein n=1 Tax=Zobellella denitrificans TaxID=347534 RepID=A0A291HLS3_9GAMM|nr:DUF4136 domain-containing protein [Zobellella denitrificans]ATG73042.1 hypothetical protein AN401_03535 [Zobellella denitrificans]
MLRLLLVVLLLSGCAAPYDYAEDTDFSRFTTVALAPTADSQSLDGARITASALALLPGRGLHLAQPEQASLWLNYQLLEETRLLTTIPRLTARHGSFWDDEERVYGAVRELRLKLWLEEPGGRMLWSSKHPRAFPAERIKGAERSRRIEQQVAELLANYPPRD